jgi:hypothetical protein
MPALTLVENEALRVISPFEYILASWLRDKGSVCVRVVQSRAAVAKKLFEKPPGLETVTISVARPRSAFDVTTIVPVPEGWVAPTKLNTNVLGELALPSPWRNVIA